MVSKEGRNSGRYVPPALTGASEPFVRSQMTVFLLSYKRAAEVGADDFSHFWGSRTTNSQGRHAIRKLLFWEFYIIEKL